MVGHNATLVGMTSNDFTEDNSDTVVDFTGDKTKYVKLPNGIINLKLIHICEMPLIYCKKKTGLHVILPSRYLYNIK